MKRCLSVVGAVCLMMGAVVAPASAAGPVIPLEPGAATGSPSWKTFLNVGSLVSGVVPGDTETVEAEFRNQSSTKNARLKYGYYYVNKTPADSTNSFFDDLKIGFNDNEVSVNDSLTNQNENTIDIVADPYSYLVPAKTIDLAPGETGDFKWSFTFDSASPNTTTGNTATIAIAVFMLAVEDPLPPTVTDLSGSANDSVVAADDTDCITYTTDLNAATGAYTVTATTAQECEFTDGTTTREFTGTLSSEITELTPATPTIVDNPGFTRDSVTAPDDSDHLSYNLSYDQELGEWSMTTTADPGYTIVGCDNPCVTSGVLDVTPVRIDFELPNVTDKPGYLDDAVRAPLDTDEVRYQLEYDQTTGEYTLTATAVQDDNVFEDGNRTTVVTGQLNVDPVVIPFDGPLVVDNPGYLKDSVTSPQDTSEVKYELEYDQKTGEYVFGAAPMRADHVFEGGLSVVAIVGQLKVLDTVGSKAPQVVDNDGYRYDDVTAPQDTDIVKYTLDYDQAAGKWTLTARSSEGFVFSNGKNVLVTSGTLSTASKPSGITNQVTSASRNVVTTSGKALAKTGSNLGVLTGVGAGLLMAGAGLIFASRRLRQD